LNIEGRLDIQLSLDEQDAWRAKIKSSRPLAATKIFHGKTPEEVLKILPMLYNICGNAQAQAAETACLQAQGVVIPKGDNKKLAREMLVMIETAKEHLCRILIDWPGYLAEENCADELKAVLQLPLSFKRGLFEEGIAFGEATSLQTNLDQIPVLIDQLDELLQRLIFVRKPNEWFSINDRDALYEWIDQNETMVSRLLKQVQQSAWEKLGVTDIEYLPELDETLLLKQFSASDAEDFIAEPSWNNKPYESTSLARQKNHPLIKSLYKEYKNGLLTRIIARLLELAQIPSRLRNVFAMIENNDSSTSKTNIHSETGIGIGQLEAARGHLVHCVELERGIVKRYQILAPTEWNFHPLGVVAQGLKSLTTKNETLLRKQADMLINAIDPCVAYDITVH
jgi:uptake hydrogenase large subunit